MSELTRIIFLYLILGCHMISNPGFTMTLILNRIRTWIFLLHLPQSPHLPAPTSSQLNVGERHRHNPMYICRSNL